MKRSLRKLSAGKQRELELYVQIIEESFAKAIATRKADRLRNGKVLKVTYLDAPIALLGARRFAELRAGAPLA